MLKLWTIFIVLTTAGALVLAFTMRAVWIRGKISALSSPPLAAYIAANANLPPKGPRARVVLIGDSRIAQWPDATFSDRFEIVNRGIGGETTSQLADRFYSDAVALNPDVIVVEAGINDLVAAAFMDDISRRTVVQNTAETLRALARRAASSGACTFIGTVIPPARPDILRLPVWKESLRELVAEINLDLRRSQLSDRASLFDFSYVLDAVDDKILPDHYRLDTLHISGPGYKHLAQTLQSAIDACRPGR